MDDLLTIALKGRIDSENAAATEEEILKQLGGSENVVLDASELAYISSAGLRVILHVRKISRSDPSP